MPEELTMEDARRMAVEAGLTQLTDAHLRELLRAAQTARARRATLPTGDIVPADEPAHVYCADRNDIR